ncbi:MAG: hypothetical protein JSS66_14540 [Armatimonadetes bacterium]|nr:hypothetical protein [Armatimonadota bacterium]
MALRPSSLPSLALVALGFGSGLFLGRSAPVVAQVQVPPAYLKLQTATPGTPQAGHTNMTGTAIAGQFVGGGSGLTGLNASNIGTGTLASARLPNPLALSGAAASATGILMGTNTSVNNDSAGLRGVSNGGGGVTYGVWGQSNSPTGTGIIGWASSFTGNTNGVYGLTYSSSGRAVYGYANSSTGFAVGLYGDSASNAGCGVFGRSTAGTGTTYGIRGESGSTDGQGVYGLAYASSGPAYGVMGQSGSTSGRGVYGLVSASSGTTAGVWGEVASSDGAGVYGSATAAAGTCAGVRGYTTSLNGAGMVGENFSNVGNTYGVYGYAASATGYALWAQGRTGASGTKSFRIDHPADPENKFLLHYSTEMPEPQNGYNGVVKTDAHGKAWVQLPDYFESINKDFRYQLTVIDESEASGFVQVRVARKIQGNRFLIETNAPGIEVSWEVKAIRNDRWVRRYGAPVEVDKTGRERGKYLHPELYGQPEERGLNFRSLTERPAITGKP